MVGEKLVLSAEDVALATEMGRRATTSARAFGQCDRLHTKCDSASNDIKAVGAEIAFCRWFGYVYEVADGRREWDVRLPSGFTVDVKTTPYEFGMLLCEAQSAKAADVYVLMTGTIEHGFAYRGWAWRHELIQEGNRLPESKKITGRPYALPQSRLHKGPLP